MKQVDGFGKYQANEDGHIYSTARGGCRKLNGSGDGHGYLGVSLVNDEGNAVRFRVHRFIAMAFIPNPDNKEEVNHINGIKNDNRPDNLEWVTRSENLKHRYEVLGQHGAFFGKLGIDNKDSVPVIQFNMDGSFVNIHFGMAEAKRNTGANNIHQCCNGIQRSSGDYVWTYADHNNLQRVIDGLHDAEIDAYGYELFKVCERDYNGDNKHFGVYNVRQTYQATPRQKCEAILKAKGGWND